MVRRRGQILVLATVLGLAGCAGESDDDDLSQADIIVGDPGAGGQFASIQAAIDAAPEGATILVKPGEYVICSPLTFGGKRLTLFSEAGPDATTIRMCDDPADPGRASVVIFEEGETASTVLRGFTLKAGKGTRWADTSVEGGGGGGAGLRAAGSGATGAATTGVATTGAAIMGGATTGAAIMGGATAGGAGRGAQAVPEEDGGGGILCVGGSAPTLFGLKIVANSAQKSGGGILCIGTSPRLEDCTIDGNIGLGIALLAGSSPTLLRCAVTNNSKGGVHCAEGSSPTLTDCTISGNLGSGVSCFQDCSPTLTRTTLKENSADWGGGLYCNLNCFPVLTDCVISKNSVGGVALEDSCSPELSRCQITDNSGRGLSCWEGSSPQLTACTISGNVDGQGGGVACVNSSSPTLTSCTISRNRATEGGGGLYCGRYGSPTLVNCVIAENYGRFRGGGVLCGASCIGGECWGSAPTFTNCSVAGNYAPDGSGILCLGECDEEGGETWCGAADPTLLNCVVWGNPTGSLVVRNPAQPKVSYSLIELEADEPWPGDGNIEAVPLYAALGFWDDNGTPDDASDDTVVEGDYHLLPGSPCIDSGSAAGAPPGDRDGKARPLGAGVDLGAYER